MKSSLLIRIANMCPVSVWDSISLPPRGTAPCKRHCYIKSKQSTKRPWLIYIYITVHLTEAAPSIIFDSKLHEAIINLWMNVEAFILLKLFLLTIRVIQHEPIFHNKESKQQKLKYTMIKDQYEWQPQFLNGQHAARTRIRI